MNLLLLIFNVFSIRVYCAPCNINSKFSVDNKGITVVSADVKEPLPFTILELKYEKQEP